MIIHLQDLGCIFTTTFYIENIGLRRRGQQLVPVRDIHLAQTQGKIRLGFNGVAFSEKYYFDKY